MPHPSTHSTPRQLPPTRRGRRIEIRGTVQGVGFRPWVHHVARAQGIRGRVRNAPGGVTIDAFGSEAGLDRFVAQLRAEAPGEIRIDGLRARPIAPEALPDFEIAESESSGEVRPSIPPDLAPCERCLAEISDPSDRRHRYPFTSCTRCGPRFTIARAVPFDRAATTMAGFSPCAACLVEYEDEADRRFHAQANACPDCGPRLRALTPAGREIHEDPLRAAARQLRAGGIVAVKGIGGYHLACDATSEVAVTRLRQRKRRDHKPFAVMVLDAASAERLAVLDEAEQRLLAASQRPIVLLPRRPGAGLAEALAPGNPLVGLMLANAPLHQLLLAEAALPLVMTSGNRSEEPLAYRDEDALARLRDIADLLLVHDREIVSRCDDSVVRVIAGAPVVLRRGRGHVPAAVPLQGSLERPVLACGGDLKNAFCLGAGAAVHFGPHVGDLEDPDTLDSFEASVARLEDFLQLEPEIVAHDLHPDFHSSAYARARRGASAVAVQHHHAHVASVMAEHGLAGPVLGVAFDGMGYGPDGTAWGGEFLLADFAGFERLASFRPLPLAGGDVAIRQVWRLALVLLDDAFDGDPPLSELPLFRSVSDASLAGVRQLVERGVHSPLAHGVGRYFDAMGALVLARTESYHEGDVAMAWNFAADPRATTAYPYAVQVEGVEGGPWMIDLRPMVREAVADLLAGCPAGMISGRFHATLARATAEVVGRLAERHGLRPVVLAGGCFQNPRLVEETLAELTPRFRVFRNRAVPPGDGGLALGQALIADAVARREGPHVPRRSG